MIKIIKGFEGKTPTTDEIDEADFPQLESFEAMEEKMIKQHCHTLCVKLEDGFQVMYTRAKYAN